MILLPSPPGRGAGGEGLLSTIKARRSFARFVHDVFATRRKQLGTILGRDFSRWPDGVSSTQRPETLTVEQLVAIFTQRNKR